MPRKQATRRIIGENGADHEHRRAPAYDCKRQQIELTVEREADQFDPVGERIEQAHVMKSWARLLHAPKRVKRRGGKEHREDHEVHYSGEVLKLLYHR